MMEKVNGIALKFNMSIKLEDYEEFLIDVAPEIREVLESTFQEASRVMSPTGLQE